MSDEINLVVFVNWLVISLHKYKLIHIVLVEFSIYFFYWPCTNSFFSFPWVAYDFYNVKTITCLH